MSDAAHSPTVREALAAAAALGLDRVDAQALLGHALGGKPRAWLIAHDTDPLPPEAAAAFDGACRQRADGVPVAYLLGEREFHGLVLRVTPDVLVPRPDTETLVDWALELLPGLGAAPRVLDLGTGSGAIALAVAHRHAAAQVQATDLSAAALAVARANAQRLGLAVAFAEGAWWQAVPATATYTLVLSNPPYIAGGDPHLPALRHEPTLALTPGGDGLDAYRAIVAGAPAHLVPGGWLLFEHGFDQAEAVAALLREAGFTDIATRCDIAQRPRCTGGRWPA
ncbi:peptide chain release factor N(5)-glutamine methyltransferase [Ideonella sp. DXS22W]|uniref:Release factor glutamine methyltransferase n=1 Tax=Pseudaquabacterium inlustre TaxID=2984192 RepID=A0ABU9CNR9_9BURK